MTIKSDILEEYNSNKFEKSLDKLKESINDLQLLMSKSNWSMDDLIKARNVLFSRMIESMELYASNPHTKNFIKLYNKLLNL